MKRSHPVILSAAVLIGLSANGFAADFCRDYTRAIAAHQDALYRGYIYGFVRSRTTNDIATNAVAQEVAKLTLKYCLQKPDDPLTNVVSM